MIKKLVVLGVIAAVLGIVCLSFVLHFKLAWLVEHTAETEGSQVLGTRVRIQGAKISLFSGSGKISGMQIDNPSGFDTDYAFRTGEFRLDLEAMSVFSDKIVIEKLCIEKPEIMYELDIKGSNLKKIKDNVKANSGQSTGDSGKKIQINELRINGATVSVFMKGLDGKKKSITLPDIHLEKLGTGPDGVTAGDVLQNVLSEMIRGIGSRSSDVADSLREKAREMMNKPESAIDTAEKQNDGVKKKMNNLRDKIRKVFK